MFKNRLSVYCAIGVAFVIAAAFVLSGAAPEILQSRRFACNSALAAPPYISYPFIFLLVGNLLFHKKFNHFLWALAGWLSLFWAYHAVMNAFKSTMVYYIGAINQVFAWIALVTANFVASIQEKNRVRKRRIRGVAIFSISILLASFWYLSDGFKTPFVYNHVLHCEYCRKEINRNIEMYKMDNNGLYPDSLSRLAPTYMKRVPKCFRLDYDRKTEGRFWKMYGFNLDDYYYGVSKDRKKYTLWCEPANHGIHLGKIKDEKLKYLRKQGICNQEKILDNNRICLRLCIDAEHPRVGVFGVSNLQAGGAAGDHPGLRFYTGCQSFISQKNHSLHRWIGSGCNCHIGHCPGFLGIDVHRDGLGYNGMVDINRGKPSGWKIRRGRKHQKTYRSDNRFHFSIYHSNVLLVFWWIQNDSPSQPPSCLSFKTEKHRHGFGNV